MRLFLILNSLRSIPHSQFSIKMKKQIPNAPTLLNVFCGACALVQILGGRYTEGVIFLGVSLLADFLDGAAARALNVQSPMGKELDSLADMVSFGVVPGAILYKLLMTATPFAVFEQSFLPLLAFIITAFACYRLAKFNLDTRQSENFIGLATPACTLFFVGLLLIKTSEFDTLDNLTANPTFLYALIPIFSYLLVSEIPMFSLKLKSFKLEGNKVRFAFVGVAAVLLLGMREYILINVGLFLMKKDFF
jgi:CDP-diacylglycerol---serine O-phosphatidyltransferase